MDTIGRNPYDRMGPPPQWQGPGPGLAMGGGGGGGRKPPGKPRPPSTAKVEKPWWLKQVDRANNYYKHARIGLEAHPVLEEDTANLESFGLPVELRMIGIYEVPVFPWGWHPVVADA